MVTIKKFGLLGKDISYSFSQEYFTAKFLDLDLEGYSYENFDLMDISKFPELLESNPKLRGMNVTIPYKEKIITYLDGLDDQARKIGAVNTIRFTGGQLIGYNTDAYGFERSIEPFLKPHHSAALILGTGGASKAIAFVLNRLGIRIKYVSRSPGEHQISYVKLDSSVFNEHTIIVNCTPLGTHPNIHQKPDIPYDSITKRHLLFDLIYNPKETAFLHEGKRRGAQITNGLQMLQLQADRAWEIWQNQDENESNLKDE